MKFITVQINTEQDLEAIKAFLTGKGLKFEIEEEDWGDLSEHEIESIKAGIDDFKNGRTISHEEAMARIKNIFKTDNSD